MIHLATFSDQRTAKAFSDYLHVHAIKNRLVEVEDGYAMELLKETDHAAAKSMLDEFVNHPNDKKFLDASWLRGDTNDNISQPASGFSIKSVWSDSGVLVRYSTLLIIAIYIAEVLGAAPWLYARFSFPASSEHFNLLEIYRLVTPALMHGSLSHIVFNLFWWFWLGSQLEKEHGKRWLLNLSLVSALAAHTLQYIMENPWFLGLSGVVYGLLGYCWIAQKLNRLSFSVPNGIFVMMLIWLVVGFTDYLPVPMANWAHLGGLLAGMACAFVYKPNKVAD